MEMNNMMPSFTRQAKNDAEQQKSEENFYRKLAEKTKRYKKKFEPAPVKVYTKKAIKQLNKKMKTEGKLSSEDFEEVK